MFDLYVRQFPNPVLSRSPLPIYLCQNLEWSDEFRVFDLYVQQFPNPVLS